MSVSCRCATMTRGTNQKDNLPMRWGRCRAVQGGCGGGICRTQRGQSQSSGSHGGLETGSENAVDAGRSRNLFIRLLSFQQSSRCLIKDYVGESLEGKHICKHHKKRHAPHLETSDCKIDTEKEVGRLSGDTTLRFPTCFQMVSVF